MNAALLRVLAGLVVLTTGACVDEAWGELGTLELELVASELAPAPSAPLQDPTNRWATDPAAAALGELLFFDGSYSTGGAISCATCHDPLAGFQDRRSNVSLGLGFTGRHAPTCLHGGGMLDAEHGDIAWQFWDGRGDSLWSQALGPPENDVEMGGSRSAVAYMIYDRYRSDYEAVFGAMPQLRDADGVARTPEHARPGQPEWEQLPGETRAAITAVYVGFGKAIDAYERRLLRSGSDFDRFLADLARGDADHSRALSERQRRGLSLFVGKADCIACHNGANFSDGQFHNLGISQLGPHLPELDRGRADGIKKLRGGEFNCVSRWSDHPDKSRCAVVTLTVEDEDVGAFKTPSLRDVAITAPYMHTGTLATLDEVVRFYDAGGDAGGFVGARDGRIQPLGLSEDEIADLVAFLESLTGKPATPELTVTG